MGEININNLTGAAKAFAVAADQNNDGKIDGTFEKKLFNQFITGAKLTGDEGIVLERQAAAQAPDEPIDPKKAQKEEKKMYENYFGKNNVDAIKNKEAESNRRVINAFKQLVATGQMSPDELNAAIASRPDMADYNGDAESYKTALENWASDVEQAFQTNLKSEIRGGTEAVIKNDNANTARVINNDNKNTAMIMANDDANTAFQAALTLEVGEALAEKMDANTQAIIDEVKSGNAQVIKAIKTAEGNIIHVVKTEAGKTRAFITDAKNQIIGVTQDEAFITRVNDDINTASLRGNINANTASLHRHIYEDGARTRSTVNNRADELHEHLDENERNEHRRDFNPLMPNTWF